MTKYLKNFLLVAFLIAIVFMLTQQMNNQGSHASHYDYSAFLSMIHDGKISSGTLSEDRFQGKLTDGTPFTVDIPSTDSGQRQVIDALATRKDIQWNPEVSKIPKGLQFFLVNLLFPILIFVFFWLFMMKQAQAGGNQALAFGRSRAKRVGENMPKITFKDVAGVDEAKEELTEVVEFLKSPKKFQEIGAKIPKGVLLLGPPGCGKTLLARAVAGEAGVPFYHISGSDFVEMFVGVGASRVRDLFETAKTSAPSLIFIDEIDAVGRQRGAGLGGGHDEREQTLNQLLVEMDGFDQNRGVILIAATNRPDVLDPALLRPGRFDRRVTVDNPDANGRKEILKIHVKGKPLADDVSLETLSRRTPGFSGADLANLVNESALLAIRRGKKLIGRDEFEESIERVVAGPERKSRIISEKEKAILAYHEVGHAIVLELLPNADPVHKVSILPRGMALGYTLQLPIEDKYMATKDSLLDDITGLLAGRVSEELNFGEVTTGAQNDFERATELARRMVTEFGMSKQLGPMVFGRRHANPFLGRDLMEDRNYSEDVAKIIDSEVHEIIESCYERAKGILSENKEAADRIVKVLLERESLEREQFEALMKGDVLDLEVKSEENVSESPAEPEIKAADEAIKSESTSTEEPSETQSNQESI